MDKDFLFDEFTEQAAAFIEKQLDVDRLLALTKTASSPSSYRFSGKSPVGKIKIAIAKDEAFNFIYHENINLLASLGEIHYFSPLTDIRLPEADLVYLPGGYPELFLETLSQNTAIQVSIRTYVEQGGKLWAECGGMMYLSRSITDKDGKEYPMVGIFDQKATMQEMKLTLGYRQFRYNNLLVTGQSSIIQKQPDSFPLKPYNTMRKG